MWDLGRGAVVGSGASGGCMWMAATGKGREGRGGERSGAEVWMRWGNGNGHGAGRVA